MRPQVGTTWALAGAAAACWAAAARLETSSPRLGDVARCALLVPAAIAMFVAPEEAILVILLVTSAFVVDAVRTARPDVALGAALVVHGLVAQVALASGVSGPAVGVALCIGAVAWAGLAGVVEEEWRPPLVAAAAIGVSFGLAVSAGNARMLSYSLTVAGALGIAGLVCPRSLLGHVGGAAVTLGVFGHLALAGVTALEIYLAPVALQLTVAGWQAQRRSGLLLSSWAAYAPALALSGGVALAERMAGGAGWHAVVAGGVGVLAVGVGGWRRLAGPMVLGTLLLAVLTIHESLSALAGVPTWAWLALGGSTLLAAGVLLERADTSPGEAGRRIVDVLAERFD